MLIIHGTATLLDTIGATPLPHASLPQPESLLGTWQGSLFVHKGKPCFAFMHDRTHLPLIIPATVPLDVDRIVTALAEHLARVGIPEALFRPHLDSLTHVVFAKTADRSLAAALAHVVRELGNSFGPVPENGIYDPTHAVIHDSLWHRPIVALDALSPLQLLHMLFDGKALPALPQSTTKAAAKPAASKSRPRTPAKAASASPLTLIRPDGSKAAAPSTRAGKQPCLDEIVEILADAYEYNIPPDDVLKEIMEETPDPGGDLGTILLTHPSDNTAEAAMMMLFFAATEHGIPHAVCKFVGKGAVPVLEKGMRNPDVTDRRKLMIGPLLMKFGAPFPEDDYKACFQDFDAALAALKPEIPPVTPTPACVDKLLDCAELPFDVEDERIGADDHAWELFTSLAHHTLEESPEVAAMMVATAATAAIWHDVQLETLFSELFHGIAESNAPEVRWQLETLGCWPFSGNLGALATEAARDMQIRGVECRHTLHRDFSHGLLSMVDGTGTRQMTLFFRTPEGGMDAIVFLLRNGWGIKDVMTFYEECDAFQESMSESGLLHCPCTVPLAREMLTDALSLHALSGKRVPPRTFLARQYLGAERLLPRSRTPNLGVYMLETLRRTPELVANCEPMLEEEAFGGLWFHSDAAYRHVRTNKKGGRSRMSKAWLDTFIREACVDDRETLLQCMAINLEVEALAGRAKKTVNKMAARNYLAIAENVVPFETIPYVRALAERGARVILDNLKKGYNSQAEANQAALERDNRMRFMMEDLFWSDPDDDDI